MKHRLDPVRLAESVEGLATTLSMAVGLIVFNGLNPTGIFFTIGMFYLATGLYYGVATPIQPMTVVTAYAVATGIPSDRVLAAGLMLGLTLLAVGASGAVERIRGWVAPPVIHGLHAAVGLLLMAHGMRLIAGKTNLQVLCQAVEPHLKIQSLGPLPIGVVIGVAGVLMVMMRLENRRLPAGLVLMAAGIGLGLILGDHDGLEQLRPGIYLPRWLPYGFPAAADLGLAAVALVLPQLPATLEKAGRMARHFGPQARRVTPRALCVGMGMANLVGFVVGGIALDHGAGGPAARRCAEGRKTGTHLAVGAGFTVLALAFGFHTLSLIHLLPLAVLGALFVLIGCRLSLAVLEVGAGRQRMVALVTAGIALAANLGIGLLVGIGLARVFRSDPGGV